MFGLFSGSEIEESVIPDHAGIVDWQICITTTWRMKRLYWSAIPVVLRSNYRELEI